ncbi:MAG: SpoVR family protein [Planctomycetaceae bacterium]
MEEFIDACLSIEDLIDPHAPHIACFRAGNPPLMATLRRRTRKSPEKFPRNTTWTSLTNPPEVPQREQEQATQGPRTENRKQVLPGGTPTRCPAVSDRTRATPEWQRDASRPSSGRKPTISPQGQTKIMNEGWASYRHSTIMTGHGLTDAELIDYADHHSGTMATSPTRLNPTSWARIVPRYRTTLESRTIRPGMGALRQRRRTGTPGSPTRFGPAKIFEVVSDPQRRYSRRTTS